MSNRWPNDSNFSVPQLKEENNSEMIPWTEDIKVLDLHLKYEEERNESTLIEISGDKKEKFDEKKQFFFKSEPNESNDSNFGEQIDDEAINVSEPCDIKKETVNENIGADEFKYSEESSDDVFYLSAPIEINGYKKEEFDIKKYGDESSDDIFNEFATIEINGENKEEFDGKKPSFFKSEPNESYDGCSDKEIYNEVMIVREPCDIKRQTINENVAAELTQQSGDQLVSHLVKHKKQDTIDCHKSRLIQRHSLAHKNDTFKCSDCSYESKTKVQLSVHQLKHESMEKWHSCSLCPFKTHSKKILSVHSRRRHGTNPSDPKQVEIFKCTECSYENGFKGNLKMHQLIHDQSRWLQCPNCVYKTPYPSLFKKHQVRHQDENGEGWHRCQECSFKTPSKYSLRCHGVLHKSANEIRWFKCSQCSYQTPHQYGLRRHQSYKHKQAQEIEWFFCYECSFKTKQKSHLVRHVPTHKKHIIE